MKTVFPQEPAKDFNDWMNHIKQEIDKSKKVKEEIDKSKKVKEEVESNTYEGSRERIDCFFI